MKKPYIKVLIGVAAILLAVIIAIIALWPDDRGNHGIVGDLWNPTTTASRVPNGTTARPAVTTTTTTAAPTTTTTIVTTVTETTTTTTTTTTTEPTTTTTTATTTTTTTEPTTTTATTTTTTVPSTTTTTAPTTTTTTATTTTTTAPTTTTTTTATTTATTTTVTAPTLILPTQTNPSSAAIQFPYAIEEYGLVIERMAPYTGKYVEDGSNTTATNVAMLLVSNNSEYPIEFASLTVEFEGTTLLFDVSALPAGSRAVVQEKMRRAIPDGQDPIACKALVAQRAEQEFAADQVSVTENEDGSLTVTNLTDTTIPTVRVFYKYYLDEEQIYVGGIAFTAKVSQLRPHSSYTIRPTHYEKGSSRIVMVAAYEEDAG